MKKLHREKFVCHRRRRSGSVILMVTMGMVALCGFCALAVDYGRMIVVKNQLQRGADAGALAGVKYLPSDTAGARQAAVFAAFQNGVTVDPNSITFSPANSRIRVPAVRNVRFFFAPVLKIYNGNVDASATASAQMRNNFYAPQVVPIGITPATYSQRLASGTSATLTEIRANKKALGNDDFVLFDLRAQNSKSPEYMQRQLQWNSDFTELTHIGGTETTLNASDVSQGQKFEGGMQTRVDAASQAPYYDNGQAFTSGGGLSSIPAGSPRLVYFIVVPEQQPVSGNNNAQVIAFAPAYVESYSVTYSKKESNLVGDLLNGADEGDAIVNMRVRMLPLRSGNGGLVTEITGPLVGGQEQFLITRLVQ